ncbi:opacity family porin [Conchiformibius kuhniae]|uniref:Opacity family porin n=1 Tax=Conchiformibius kuhniae TaxID=211502 RepID=A0A8T9MX24_9NEIS|nr:opacity family porin [Conchiformibius kuhniae]UOP04453.1 opacity family porin [Conchiformibius kuhniae]
MVNKSQALAVTLAVCGAAAQTASADGTGGVYVQGDIGVAALQVGSDARDRAVSGLTQRVYRRSTVLPRLGGGYDFGDWRLGGDYTHYPRISKGKYAKAQAQSLGVSAIYDVDTGTALQPYVGARLSLNRVKSTFGDEDEYIAHDKIRVSPGVMAGVSLQVDRQVAVDAGYRYNHMDANMKAHEVSLGMRYTF